MGEKFFKIVTLSPDEDCFALARGERTDANETKVEAEQELAQEQPVEETAVRNKSVEPEGGGAEPVKRGRGRPKGSRDVKQRKPYAKRKVG